jgi:hypothetical protein
MSEALCRRRSQILEVPRDRYPSHGPAVKGVGLGSVVVCVDRCIARDVDAGFIPVGAD